MVCNKSNTSMLPAIIEGYHLVAINNTSSFCIIGMNADDGRMPVHTEHGLEVVERCMHLVTSLPLHSSKRILLSQFAIDVKWVLNRTLMASDGREALVNPFLNPEMRLPR